MPYRSDPWFPIALMLIVLLTVWLGIFGPLPTGITGWLLRWQTLFAASVAATVASIAAYIAFRNTSRSLAHAEELEKRRRNRKHAALRAMLPLALAAISDYAERSSHALNDLLDGLNGEGLPWESIPETLANPLPTEALKTLADFIEYSDTVNAGLLEATVAWIQIHDSRVRSIVKDNRNPKRNMVVVRHNIESSLIDAASIYAGAGSAYDYARHRSDQIPPILSWEAVRGALRNMRFWDDQHTRIFQIIDGRERNSVGPFERLTATSLTDSVQTN